MAEILVGKTGRLISAGGFPAYRGFYDPEQFKLAGMPVPTYDDGPKVASEQEHPRGYRIRVTEEKVLALHPQATHMRYPYVYGPRQPAPREWCIVRRILDGRRQIILPEGGLTLCTFGYSRNIAHAVLLAVDNPAASAGQNLQYRRRTCPQSQTGRRMHLHGSRPPDGNRVNAVGVRAPGLADDHATAAHAPRVRHL